MKEYEFKVLATMGFDDDRDHKTLVAVSVEFAKRMELAAMRTLIDAIIAVPGATERLQTGFSVKIVQE